MKFTTYLHKKVDLLTNKILQLFDRHAPLCKVRVTKPKAPWFTDVLKIMKKGRNNLMSKYKRSRSNQDWEAYKVMRNLFTQAVRNEKKAYINFVAQNNNKKDMWRALDNLTVYNKSKNNISLPSNLNKPDHINNYFVESVKSIAPPVNGEFVKEYQNTMTTSTFKLQPVRDEKVLKAISELKSNASGADGLSLYMIKLCCPVIVPFLVHIFNICITESLFPSSWKVAMVVPLPKVNHPKEISDLRPISLLPTMSKVYEKMIYLQITEYFNTNNLFPTSQSGFRRGYSTATVLLKVLDDIIEAGDRGETSALVLLDYSKAFDTLDHRLADRSQFVFLEGKCSSSRDVERGVPQGSILGPLLFVLFTTDMNRHVKDCDMQRYADNTQLRISFNQLNAMEAKDKLTQCLKSVYDYSLNNGLKLNPNKSAIIYFGTDSAWASENMRVDMDGSVIPVVKEYKNLGVIFDTKLRFRSQVSKVIQRSYLSLRNLYKSKNILRPYLKKTLCETLVLSHANYCNFVYGPCLDLQCKDRLQRVQNSCRYSFYLWTASKGTCQL